ncbi:MAG: AbrB/MazE/SpoVT family DNA-binding domain-containing protein [Planctomycetota bacterium]|nr:AbrB/MazE/SpoVT family DNA-binding domain-containing protein [Planctomycetota bacterium]
MVTTVVTTKGQIVIPSKIRQRRGIKKGTRLCIIEKDDEIVLQPLTREYFHKIAGILQSRKGLVGELLSERTKDKEREETKCKK